MQIVIIEDEPLAAEDLKAMLLRVSSNIQIKKVLDSVTSAIEFFTNELESIDLIFSDIQLGDGSCFSIFSTLDLKIPIVFCTAYDVYALDAFKYFGIHYVLKPFTFEMIQESIHKFNSIKYVVKTSETYQALYEGSINKPSYILVTLKEKIIPIPFSKIAFFYINFKSTQLITFDQEYYLVNKSLEELEFLTDNSFYRANRQFLIQRSVIKEVSQIDARKLKVEITIPFDSDIIISKLKSQEFLFWLKL